MQQLHQISDLSSQIEGLTEPVANKEDKNLYSIYGDCLLCCDKSKSIVFLPCGHVLACLHCTVNNLKIELNKKFNRKRFPNICPLCKGVISEARELNFMI